MERPGLLEPRPLVGALAEDGSRGGSVANRRPADVFLPRWRQGLPCALDFAVSSGLRTSIVEGSARDGSSCARAYEAFKCEHLNTRARCEEEGITFLPMVVEAHGGGWGQEAHKVWAQLAKLKCSITGERESSTACNLLQRSGVVLHRENAGSILRRWPSSPLAIDQSYLAAVADSFASSAMLT